LFGALRGTLKAQKIVGGGFPLDQNSFIPMDNLKLGRSMHMSFGFQGTNQA
jgi:hypothetical protein